MPEPSRARRVLSLFAAATFAVALTLVATSPARASTTPGADAALTNVISIAMQSLDRWEGECFPWVRRVIQQATGRTIGWDYRQGYLQAGAVEVALDAVQEGDVIQMADDANSGPSVSYAGLHTAIVMTNHGGGVLTVIDSNSQWDGVVRIRTGYNPAVLATRYPNITARAYRFPGVTSGTQPQVTPNASLVPGGSALVAADGDCLRLRSSAGVAGVVLTCLPDSTVVTVMDGSTSADGLLWRQITALGRTGWVAEQYLQPLGSGPVTPPPTTTPTTPTTPTTTTPPASTPSTGSGSGQIVGSVPSRGVGLVVWSGGATTSLVSAAQSGGCNVASVWSAADGQFVGYTPGAPSFVNRGWESRFPGGNISGTTALVVLCGSGAAPSTPAPSTPAPTTPTTPTTTTPPAGTGTSPAPAQGGGTPPGPAGNE